MSDVPVKDKLGRNRGGRPFGSKGKPIRDLRPVIMKMLEKALSKPKHRREMELYLDSLPIAEKMAMIMTMARLGVNASPKSTEVEGSGIGISLFVNNIRQTQAIDGHAVDAAVPVLPEHDPSAVDPTRLSGAGVDLKRLPQGPAEKCPGLRGVGRKPEKLVDEEAPAPPRGAILTVPRFEDEPEFLERRFGKMDVPKMTDF